MPTISGNSDLSVNASKRLRRRFGMTGWILILGLLFCAKSGLSQDKKDKLDSKKSLHEVAVKLYEHTATEAEYLFLQNLYRSTSNASNKRYVLSLAAQYQRQVLKNPVKTLELVLPQLIAKQELAMWSKGQEKISRSRNAQAEDYVQNLGNLPDVTEWRVEGSRGLLALEAAHALFALKLTEDAFALIDSVGRNNNDHVRVLAAEVLAECYIKNEEYKNAKDSIIFAQEYQKKLQNRDFYHEKGDREFDGDARALISRRLSEKAKFLNTNKTNVAKNAVLPSFDMTAWPAAKPKVDRLEIKAQVIICMISDSQNGAYVGTEDHGVYWYKNDGNIVQYKDELGDPNCYSMCLDKKGRLWVGHLNSGVSVFNGQKWQNYDVIDGPIGERIFDIQCCPVDGDIFLATSAGITRYRTESDTWEHFTREDDLVEDQAASLAFQNDGTLLVGTQCHGLAVFKRNRNGEHSHDKNIIARERFGPGNCSPVPLEPFGTEMPTNQINQVLVAKNETVWIATPTGLVKANKNLTKFSFVRGKDYADKVHGLYGGAPKGWKECATNIKESLLPEDYVTCLSEDANGTIWIGTRRSGFMAIDPVTGRRGTGDRASMGMADNYVSSILSMQDGMPLIGLYIGGVIRPKMELTLKNKGENDIVAKKSRSSNENMVSVAQSGFPKLPSPMRPPTVEELKAMQAKLEKLKKPLPKVFATVYGEDWKTQGDWVGRYGRQYAILCAVNAPYDRKMYRNENEVQVNDFIGPNTPKYDVIRRWVHWLKTEDRRVLYDPYTGARRQAEWDDHGEVYSINKDGPDVWYLLNIKKQGVYRLSMYFFNKDGHTGMNRMRDYMVAIYPFQQSWLGFEKWPYFAREAERTVRKVPPLAQTRVKDFWGGEYKTFVVTGPGLFAVKIDDNYSFNTIISSVMVDRMVGPPDRYDNEPTPWTYTPYYAPKLPDANLFRTEEGKAAFDAWTMLSKQRDKLGVTKMEKEMEWQIFRMAAVAVGQGVDEGKNVDAEMLLVNHLMWKVKFWNDELRNDFNLSMKASWQKFCEFYPEVVAAMNTKRVDRPRKRTAVDIWTRKK